MYKLEEPLGLESWHFAIEVAGGVASLVDEIRVEYRAKGAVIESAEFRAAGLSSRRVATDRTAQTVRYAGFDGRSPVAAELDELWIVALAQGRALATRAVGLHRYREPVALRLPLDGCWFVASGHDVGLEHRRWLNRAHFAWDLLRVDANGATAMQPDILASHYAFGATVRAPAAGWVVAAVDGFADQPPGHPGASHQANYVLIEHAPGLVAKLMHLRRGSLRVRVGDQVRAGQAIAEVGNSGRSDAPHLHVHFQSSASGQQDPIPAQFSGYRIGAQHIERGRPRRGEFVCSDAAE